MSKNLVAYFSAGGVTGKIADRLAAAKIFSYLEKHPEKENIFLLASFIVG